MEEKIERLKSFVAKYAAKYAGGGRWTPRDARRLQSAQRAARVGEVHTRSRAPRVRA